MAEIVFTRGEFQAFRAITKVHLGAIETDLEEGEVILFDGQMMKRGGAEHVLSSLRAAIKAGWLVPEHQIGGTYRAQPADIQIHDACPTGMGRGEGRRIHTVEDEEVNLGHIAQIRSDLAPEVHVASNAGEISRGAPTGVRTADHLTSQPSTATTSHGQEGAVIASRFKTSAKNGSVEVGKDDKRIVNQLDTLAATPKPRPHASGDVQSAMSGEDLSEILPNAASAKRPQPGVAGEGSTDTAENRAMRLAAERRAQATRAAKGGGGDAPTAEVIFTPGSTPVGSAEDGVVIGTVAGRAASLAGGDDGDDAGDDVPAEAILQAKIEIIQSFVPGFQWDMKEHWRTRVKKAVELQGNMPVLNAVLSIETATVKKHVMQTIYGG